MLRRTRRGVPHKHIKVSSGSLHDDLRVQGDPLEVSVINQRGIYCFRTVADALRYISSSPATPSSPLWVDFRGCIPLQQMNEISAFFGIHPLTATDCLQPDSPSKWYASYPSLLLLQFNNFLPCDVFVKLQGALRPLPFPRALRECSPRCGR